MTQPSNTDPRRPGGDIAGPGGPSERDAVVLDTSKAVLLDGATACVAHLTRQGDPFNCVALMLEGKINQSSDRSRVLYLTDYEGAADIVAHLLSLAQRDGRDDDFAVMIAESSGWA